MDSIELGGSAIQKLTLRDYFAAKAMQSFIALSDDPQTYEKEVAGDAFSMADAMIERREKTPFEASTQ